MKSNVMKANELMVGNYVWLNHESLDIYSIFKVKEVLSESVRLCDMPEGEDEWELKYIEPVELTPKMLEKNEFSFGHTSYEEDFASAIGASMDDAHWCWDDGSTIEVTFDNNSDYAEIKLWNGYTMQYLSGDFEKIHVHELQNMINLIGIDKEIVL